MSKQKNENDNDNFAESLILNLDCPDKPSSHIIPITLALYRFYCHQANYQETSRPKCTTKFAANALHVSQNKIRQCKNHLRLLGLIEDIKIKAGNKIIGHYIKVNKHQSHPIRSHTGKKQSSHSVESLIKTQSSHSVESLIGCNKSYTTYSPYTKKDKLTVASQGRDDVLLIDFGGKQQINNRQSFDKKCCQKLIELLQTRRKVFRKINLANWITTFKKLRIDDGIKKSRIKKVLIWYIKHFGEDYVPEAYSAKSFRDKFLQIESSKDRQKSERERKRYEGDIYNDYDPSLEEGEWNV